MIVLAILLLVGIFTFIVSNVTWDLFGMQIKEKVKSILPVGTKTDSGEVQK